MTPDFFDLAAAGARAFRDDVLASRPGIYRICEDCGGVSEWQFTREDGVRTYRCHAGHLAIVVPAGSGARL